MAVNFIEQKKRQKYLILVFLIIIVITGVVLWFGYFKKEKPVSLSPKTPFREIRIDFDILESPFLKEMQPFERIPFFEGEEGRENPFLSY